MTEEKNEKSAHVISLESRLKKGATPMLTVPRAPVCWGHHFFLDRETRLVSCKRCKLVFDGFEAIVYLAEHWGDFNANRRAIEIELKKAREERDELKKEADRLTGFVRRKYRAIAETSEHATRALELLLRIHRKPATAPYSSDRRALSELLDSVELAAKIVPLPREGT